MHTIVVLIEGFVLLGACLLVARLLTRSDTPQRPRAIYTACKIFIALWLVCALFNLWRGVSEAGYSVVEELPIFALVFGLPAVVAALVGHRTMIRIDA